MAQELSATPQADRFSYFVLSDTSLAHVAAAEEAYVAQWRQRAPGAALHYRRRTDNEGFKAGNVRAFCRDHYDTQDCMIALDADSQMDAPTILRLARIAARWPQIGVLQSLVVGAPSKSAFARLFQFGMRAGMRSYTMGGAWWGADCGPFWGHNALVRVRPFYDHCALPTLPGKPPFGGAILSHDQVEAVLMRRAGFEARVLPEETGSYEDNPPDMLEFSQRDMRWCQGNMQYGPIIGWPGLKPMSRFQLVWAILMFLGLPASFLLIFLAALKPFDGETHFPADAAIGFWSFYLLLGLAPKLGGFIDALADRGARRYGGPLLFLMNAALELVGSFLLSAPVGFRTALFMAGLPFGANLGWGAQNRDGGGLALADCARAFWPGSLFGAVCLGLIAYGAPGALVFALPYAAGLVLAVPFAWITARPGLGLWMQRYKICAIPEEMAQR
jgi:membrane glycosyltransferase